MAANFNMDPDKFRNTMSSLNYGTVMEAAARNLAKASELAGSSKLALLEPMLGGQFVLTTGGRHLYCRRWEQRIRTRIG